MNKQRINLILGENDINHLAEIRNQLPDFFESKSDSDVIRYILSDYLKQINDNEQSNMYKDIQMILNMMLHLIHQEQIDIQYQPQQFETYHQLKHQLSELMKGNYKTTMVPKKENIVDTSPIHEDNQSSVSSLNIDDSIQTSSVDDFLDQYR